MRSVLAPLLALCAVSLATPAGAAEKGVPTAVKLNEVERGFWVGSSIGAVFYPSLPGDGEGSGSGVLVGVELGYDLTRNLQIGALVWGQAIGAAAEYRGITDIDADPKGARGDFQSVLAGGTVRWSFLDFDDENGIDRTHLYLRAAGGMQISRPVGVIGDGLWASVGPGVEYFTRLRHFSVGLEVNGIGMQTDEGDALGFAVLPHLKYSF